MLLGNYKGGKKGRHWKVKDTSKIKGGKLGRHWKLSKKARENHNGFKKGHPSYQTENGRKKMSKTSKGKHYSPKTEWKKGQVPWNKDKKLTEEHIEKLRKSHLGYVMPESQKKNISKSNRGVNKGEKNGNWNDGSSFEPYSIDWTKTLKRSIRERDHYICQLCGKTQIQELEEIEKKLAVHHIDYDKKNCNPDNLITLCNNCHGKTGTNRDYWIKYFKGL